MRSHLVFLALWAVTTALPSVAQSTRDNTVENEIAQKDRDFHAARLRNDVAAVNRFLAPDYYQINTSGQRIESGNSGVGPFNTTPDGRPWSDVEIRDHRVRVYGDAAVSTYLRVVHLRPPNGRATTAELVMSHVWARRDDQWLLVLSQGTSVQE